MLAQNFLERIGRSLTFELFFGLVAFTIFRCNMCRTSCGCVISLATKSEFRTSIFAVCTRNCELLALAVQAIDWQFAPRVLGALNRFDPKRSCGFRTTAGPTSRLPDGSTKTEFVVAIPQEKTVFSRVIKVGFRKRKVRSDARAKRWEKSQLWHNCGTKAFVNKL